MPTLRRRFFKLALINLLASVTVPLAGLVDTAMLGHLDEIRFLAGVALASLLFDYLYWSFGFLRMGTTGTTAQAMGRGDRDEVYLLLYRSLLLAGVLGVAVLALQLPLRELGFWVLSGEASVEQAGRAYFNARIWGAPATFCNFALLGWYLGREESRHGLSMAIAANLSNIALNYVFIIRMQLAAFGAGLATMLAQYVMLAVALSIFFARHRQRVPWRMREVLSRRMTDLFRLNLEILVRTICLVTSFAVFTNVSSTLGTAVLAANSILMRLFALAAYLIDGAAFASESLAGMLRGRRDLDGLRRLFRLSLVSGTAVAALFLVSMFAAMDPLFRLLTSHRELIVLAKLHAPWLIPVLVFGALAFMYDGLFLGLTEGRVLRNRMLISTLLVFGPVAALAYRLQNNHLLWFAMALFMIARAETLRLASRRLFAGYGTAP